MTDAIPRIPLEDDPWSALFQCLARAGNGLDERARALRETLELCEKNNLPPEIHHTLRKGIDRTLLALLTCAHEIFALQGVILEQVVGEEKADKEQKN